MDLLSWFDGSFPLRFALTLLHFLWQGCVVTRAPAARAALENMPVVQHAVDHRGGRSAIQSDGHDKPAKALLAALCRSAHQESV